MTLFPARSIIISQVNYMLLHLDEFLRLLNWILLRHFEVKELHFNVLFIARLCRPLLLRRWPALSFCLFIRCLLIGIRRHHLMRHEGQLFIFYDHGSQTWCHRLAYDHAFLTWMLLLLVDFKTLILLSWRVPDITFKRISSLCNHTPTKMLRWNLLYTA